MKAVRDNWLELPRGSLWESVEERPTQRRMWESTGHEWEWCFEVQMGRKLLLVSNVITRQPPTLFPCKDSFILFFKIMHPGGLNVKEFKYPRSFWLAALYRCSIIYLTGPLLMEDLGYFQCFDVIDNATSCTHDSVLLNS